MKKNKAVAGLDMKPALDWYHKNETILFSQLPLPSPALLFYPLVDHGYIQLLKAEMAALIALFPVNAIRRTVLKRIIGKPLAWFHRKSNPKKPFSTEQVEKVLSHTAIIPSSTDFTQWITTGQPSADIWLYRVGALGHSTRITRLILSQGFVHEFGHTIIAPAVYLKGYTLKLPNDRIVAGRSYFEEFAKLAEQHPAISHYSSVFRGEDNLFDSSNLKYRLMTVSEELAETIAAYLLGFSFCGDEQRNRQPLADRPEIKEWVEAFLKAERIK